MSAAVTTNLPSLAHIHVRAPEVAELYLNGVHLEQIERRLGMSKTRVAFVMRLLREHGIIGYRNPKIAGQHAVKEAIEKGLLPRRDQGERVKCLSCQENFQSFDRRRNRICPSCHQRDGW